MLRRPDRLLLASLLVLLAAPATAGKKTKPKVFARGLYAPLVAPGARRAFAPSEGDARVVVETYDARAVGKARVARRRWSVVDEQGSRQ
jgi:hypothetical protein